MFYSEYVLTKKGPYAKIWLAAHLDNKLTKSQIAETDIVQSVESITQPVVPIALRTTGHLLLGVVKIYRRKVKYVLNECNETMTRIKLQVVPHTKVDLPEKSSLATFAQITMPDKLTDLDMMLPDIDLQMLTSSAQVHTSHFRQLVDDLDEWYTEDTPIESSPGPYTQTQTQDNLSLGSLDRARREETPHREAIVDLPPIDFDLDHDFGQTPSTRLHKTPSTATTAEVPYMPELPEIPMAFEEHPGIPSEPRKEPTAVVASRKRKRAVIQDDPVEIPNHQFQDILKDTRDLKRQRQSAPLETLEEFKPLSTKQIFQTPASFACMPESLTSFFSEGLKSIHETISEISSQMGPAREVEPPMDFDIPPYTDIEELPAFETPSARKTPIPESAGSSEIASRMQLPQSAQTNRIGELEMQLKTPLSGKGLDAQTITCVALLIEAFEKSDVIKTLELIGDSNRLTAAQIFYQILLLKTRGFIQTKQLTPMGEIEVTKTSRFSELTTLA